MHISNKSCVNWCELEHHPFLREMIYIDNYCTGLIFYFPYFGIKKASFKGFYTLGSIETGRAAPI